MNLVLANQVADRRCRDHHLGRSDAPRPAELGQQRLTHDALEHERQLGAHLCLLVVGKHVDDPVDRLICGVGVRGREREVTRLGDPQCRLDRLEIPQLPDQDHVRVFTQCGAQGRCETLCVAVQLALVDETVFVGMDVLDRVLDREDVRVPLRVDLVDHRGKRRALSAPGRPGHQHQPPGPLGQPFDHPREPQLPRAQDHVWDQPVDGRDRTALTEDVAPEPADPADAEGEIELVRLFEALLLAVGQHAVRELFRLGGAQ